MIKALKYLLLGGVVFPAIDALKPIAHGIASDLLGPIDLPGYDSL